MRRERIASVSSAVGGTATDKSLGGTGVKKPGSIVVGTRGVTTGVAVGSSSPLFTAGSPPTLPSGVSSVESTPVRKDTTDVPRVGLGVVSGTSVGSSSEPIRGSSTTVRPRLRRPSPQR